jgi:hypothetical protein
MKRPQDRTVETLESPLEVEPGSESAGQAGDTQGLPDFSTESEESLQDLVETGQDVEAEVVEGMEQAAAHPEEPVPDHEVRRRDSVDRV